MNVERKKNRKVDFKNKRVIRGKIDKEYKDYDYEKIELGKCLRMMKTKKFII